MKLTPLWWPDCVPNAEATTKSIQIFAFFFTFNFKHGMFRHVKNSWGLVYFSFGLRFGQKNPFFKNLFLQRGFTPFPGKDVWRHIQGHTLVWGVCCSSTGYFQTVLKMDLKTYRHRCKIDTKHSGTELLRSSLRASRVFLALVFFYSRGKYNKVAENGAELLTPVLPFCV